VLTRERCLLRKAARLVAAAETRPPAPTAPHAFGLPWVEHFLPHYVTCAPSQLHRDLADRLATFRHARGQRSAYSAPRGSAKTTLMSKAFPLYSALEGCEPLTLLLAETGDQAKTYLDAIKREVEENPRVAEHYPRAAGKGPVWQANRVRLRNGCEIVARGSGGRVLGMTAGQRRPTLVVVDDGNERGDAYSPTKRRRKLEWFRKDVLPVGEPGTNVVVAGTAIHREAIVCDLRRAGWEGGGYKAVCRMPDRHDLWAEWERLRCNLADPGRELAARDYYADNRDDMDAGAELLWPERLSLYHLMEYRATAGEPAFRSEYQDDPGSPEGAEWSGELFERADFWFDHWPEDLTLRVVALDPSKGAGEEADYQGHVLLGLGKDGTFYFDAEARREDVSLMVGRALRLAHEWGADSLVLEDNATMGLLRPEVVRQQQDRPQLAAVPWETLTQAQHKGLRIMRAGPYLARAQVRVRNTPGGRMLVEQWREFPGGEHDDVVDAAGTAIRRLEILAGAGR
jgi:predicted phage terminase large subunit-like protein